MNKQSIISAGLCLFLSGCSSSLFDDPNMTVRYSDEKLKQVEPLDLFAMSVEEPTDAPAVESLPATLELTLEQVRAMTIEYNLNLKAELINPKIAAANATSTEARKFETIFNAGASYYETDFPARDLDISGSQGEQTQFNIGFATPLETGGSISLGLNDSEEKTNRSGTDYPAAYTTPLSFSVSQPLLKGGGRREFMHAIRIAKYNQQTAGAAAKLRLINTIAAADTAYWELYKNKRILEVRRQQLKLTETQLESARRFVAAGEKPQVEVLRAEAGLAGQRTSIITAENAFRHSQRRLKYILNKPGLTLDGPTQIIPATEADPVFLKLDPQKLTRYATENRMEMLQLELEIARNVSNIDHFKNANMPDVSLTYRYTINSLGTDRGGAYEQLFDKNYENHRIGLSLNVPIGRKSSKNDLLAALLAKQQLEFSKGDKISFIEQEVYDALDNLESSWQQILANRKSAILDGQLYEAEQRQFEVSMRTSTEVLQAQARFADSQSNEYIALANYQISLMELARSTGTLLGAAKVE